VNIEEKVRKSMIIDEKYRLTVCAKNH